MFLASCLIVFDTIPHLCANAGAMAPLPQPVNPQAAFNMLGSAVQAAGSVGNAGQALGNVAAEAGSGDLLSAAGSAAQAFQVRQQNQYKVNPACQPPCSCTEPCGVCIAG